MARRRFTVRDIDEILAYWHRSGGIQDTARALGVHRTTVRKYVALAKERGYTPGSAPPAEGWRAFARGVALRALGRAGPSEARERIAAWHEEVMAGLAQTTAATVWQRLRDERGLGVSLTSFYRYVHHHVPGWRQGQRLTLRREESAPGEVAEVDFASLGLWWDPVAGRRRRLYVFVLVLRYSRHMFVWITPQIDRRAWVQAHIEAFSFLGGVPAQVVLDNLKAGVLKPDIYDPRFNRAYEELARHYGFIIDPARAGKARDKPQVERAIPYVRSSFWQGRSFGSLAECHSAAGTWCLQVAGRRIHGTTGRQPLAEFTAVEQAALRPLPAEPFDLATWTRAKVAPDCHIQAGRALYSVSYRHVGKTLDVRLGDHVVQCFLSEELVKVHARVPARQRSTDWSDYPPEKGRVLRENPDWCRHRARELGAAISAVVEALLSRHAQHYLRQARGVLRLAESYGPIRLEAACARADAFGDPSYRTISGILARGLEQESPPALRTSPTAGAFLRGPAELLAPCSGAGEARHE